MTKPSPELRNLFVTYLNKPLRPNNALEYVSNFVLDLINAFGDKIDNENPLKEDWLEFAPFNFILELNKLLGKYKEKGFNDLDDLEKTLLADTQVLLGALVTAALRPRTSVAVSDERFQIPKTVAADLDYLITH